MKFLTWRWLLFFTLIAFSFAGTRPLGEPDEGRYAEAARELYRSGNWLLPQLQGHPHLTKPAFTYWMAAAGYRLLGVNEWGARLFLSLFFLLTILLVIELAKTWGWNRRQALASGLIFSTAVLPCAAGHLLTTDLFLCFWETLAVLSLWKVWKGDPHAPLWRWGFWLAFGFSFLTKGPPGWMPMLPMILFLALSQAPRPRASVLRSRQAIPAILAFVLVSLSWYLALIIRDPQTFRYFVVEEVVNRAISDKFGRNTSPVMYLFVIAGGLAPWLFLWPAFFWRLWRSIRPDAASRPNTGGLGAWLRRLGRRLRTLEDIRLFSLLWVGVMLIIFMLAKSRMPLYVLPFFVPLSIWCGRLLARMFPALWPASALGRGVAVAGCALWIACFIAVQAFAERLPIDRFLRDLAHQLTLANPGRVDHIYTLDRPPHSLSFYTGLRLEKLDEQYKKKNENDKFDRILPLMRADRKQGRLTLLAIKTKYMTKRKKLADKGYKVLAQNKALTIVMATDPPTTATLSPASARPPLAQ